jgi:hypothetical protein
MVDSLEGMLIFALRRGVAAQKKQTPFVAVSCA